MENEKKEKEKEIEKDKIKPFNSFRPQSCFEDKWPTRGTELILDLRQAPCGIFCLLVLFFFDFCLTVFCTIRHIFKSLIIYCH